MRRVKDPGTIRVLMIPQIQWFRKEESGIKRVVEGLYDNLPAQGVECVEEGHEYDLLAAHAGMEHHPDVVHCHGLYFTADFGTQGWEWRSNRDVIEALRNAREIIVPSEWVAEVIRRDMHRRPHVIGHGLDWASWAENPYDDNHYILWNKNRSFDVCDPQPVVELAKRFETNRFITTFTPHNRDEPNVQVIGIQPHDTMRKLVQGASVYLSTTKETFGIGVLEALASGVPVLGYAWGGNLELVKHGVSGYLAQPGNLDDLAEGLRYCLSHRKRLGENAKELSRVWTWAACAEKTAAVYRKALVRQEPLVTVVIPCYNYARVVGRAIESVLGQTHALLECIVVDDGSSEDVEAAVRPYAESDRRVRFIRQNNQGVANARNNGIAAGTGKYVCCLDADDRLARTFLAACVGALEKDPGLHLAYTGLWAVKGDGTQGKTQWPGEWDFSAQAKRRNQVPTCCVYRREAWENLGGYRQRYAPGGAGAEDAELWYRFGALGYRCAQVTDAPLFVYSLGTGRVSGNKKYQEPDWLAFHPEVNDGLHPFASFVKPQRFSHAVRQYDRPVVSVIIPVGPGHGTAVRDALDSLEAQTLRQWEAIVVWDAGGEIPETLQKAHPFARFVTTGPEGRKGAGTARNLGRRYARASLLLFLDADDWLYPVCLERMVEEWQITTNAVYTDYVGKAIIGDMRKLAANLRNRVLSFNETTGEAVIEYTQRDDYDCARAQLQPDAEYPYLWCNVTTLLPAPWFDEVGGFDEKMASWEDVDLWWRVARRGHCFSYIREPLLVYRFYTGSRRDELAADGPEAAAKRAEMFRYLKEKYAQEGNPMPCTGCGKRRTIYSAPPARAESAPRVEVQNVNDSDFILCRYMSPNIGDHMVIGPAAFKQKMPGINMFGRGGFQFINYGYRAGGGVDRFYVHKDDVRAAPHLFQPVEQAPVLPPAPPPPPPPPVNVSPQQPVAQKPPATEQADEPPRPVPENYGVPDIATGLKVKDEVSPEQELQKLAGVSDKIAACLVEVYHVTTPQGILDMGREALENLPTPPGMSKRRATMIWRSALKATGHTAPEVNAAD